MKLTREEFRKYIFSYTEDEAFYKKLYLQKKKDPETFHALQAQPLHACFFS